MNIGLQAKGNNKLIYRINTVNVLNVLRENVSASRAELSRKTKLDAKTITNIVRGLLKEDLAEDIGFNESGGGRPSEKLSLKTSSNLCVGVDLGSTHVTCALVDIRGNILQSHSYEIVKNEPKRSIINKIILLIDKCSRNTARKNLRGIGLGMPGLFDRRTDILVYAANLPRWKNVPIKKILKNRFKLPVYIENCSRIMTLAEMWYGKCKNMKDFVFLDLGYGIGCGIVNNFELQLGTDFNMGEIGHMVSDMNGKKCGCGHRGCLETIASGRAIAEEYNEQSGSTGITAEEVVYKAQQGDKKALKIINKSGKYLGMAVSNLINILNPAVVVLGGKLSKAGNVLLDPMTDTIKEYAYSGSLKHLKIVRSELGDDAGALGAAVLVLRKIFELEE